MTGIITWHEERKTGIGYLTLTTDDGRIERVEHAEPITARSDSHSIASMFGDFAHVDHDGEYVHVAD